MARIELTARGASARPEMTKTLMARTGLGDEIISRLVVRFYERARADPLLGPVFAEKVRDWDNHYERLIAFWSSVALMTGRYHGRPVEAHAGLGIDKRHFARWLELFSATATEVCPAAGAAHLIDRAEAMAATIRAKVDPHASGGAV